MSRGQFELTGEVLPRWYASRSNADAYAGEEGGYGRFAREIIEAVDADVDFGRYDNDGPDGVPNSGDDDGYVDYIFIVSASAPTGFIVGDATGVAQLGLYSDFVTQDRAHLRGSIQIDSKRGAVQRGRSFADAVGIMAHEFGHFLGLPDLYDREFESEPEDDSGGIGYWGLMGHGIRGWDEVSGPNPFCAWSLGQLGWLGVNNQQLKVLSEDRDDVVFADVNAGGDVYLLPASRTCRALFSRGVPHPSAQLLRAQSARRGFADLAHKSHSPRQQFGDQQTGGLNMCRWAFWRCGLPLGPRASSI